MFSGQGQLTKEEIGLPATQVLDKHETTVREWLGSLSKNALKSQVNIAANHVEFKKFVSMTPNAKKFGKKYETCIDELCQFDVWLKKLALSQLMPPPTKPAKVTFSPLPPKPDAAKYKPVDPKGSELPELTDAEKASYKQWWGKYHTDGASSPASSGGDGSTPECKKRLALSEGGESRFLFLHPILQQVD